MRSHVTRVAEEIFILLRMANALPHLRILQSGSLRSATKRPKGVFDQRKPFDSLKSNISEFSFKQKLFTHADSLSDQVYCISKNVITLTKSSHCKKSLPRSKQYSRFERRSTAPKFKICKVYFLKLHINNENYTKTTYK